jgi:hypothetical protein
VFLSESYVEAERVAMEAAENPQRVIDNLGIEWSSSPPNHVAVIEFSNGRPVKKVKTFDFKSRAVCV